MPAYTDASWKEELEMIEIVDARELLQAVSNVRRIPFSVKSERDQARDVLLALTRTPIVKTQRFPDRRHVNLTSGPITELYDKILLVLDDNERSLDREQAVSAPGRFNAHNDAKLSFLKMCQKIVTLLSSPNTGTIYQVYTRNTFEQKYGLTWQ